MTEEAISESEAELLRALGQELQRIFAQKSEMDFDDVVNAFKAVESSYVANFGGNEFLTLETRRRVAELILYSATAKRITCEECERLFDDLSRLGFRDLERKSTVSIIYSRYCFQTGRNEQGISLLEPLEVELDDEFRHTGIELYRNLLKTTQDVLNELRTSQNETP